MFDGPVLNDAGQSELFAFVADRFWPTAYWNLGAHDSRVDQRSRVVEAQSSY